MSRLKELYSNRRHVTDRIETIEQSIDQLAFELEALRVERENLTVAIREDVETIVDRNRHRAISEVCDILNAEVIQ